LVTGSEAIHTFALGGDKMNRQRNWINGLLLGLLAIALNVYAAENGVTEGEIRIGQFAAQTGPAAELGKRMQLGILAQFNAVNAAGGIGGRKLTLVSRDDGYEPEKAVVAVKALIEDDKVFALIGSVGTPTTLAAVPAINAAGIPLIGPFTGAQALREPFNRNLFHVRASYEAELDRIRQKFTPLVKICKEYGTAMRIGTNHGSLSDRILSRYGDTPLGMVESALEFLRICESESYYDIVISMKASNPQVMVQAYRLLVAKLDEEGLQPYPLHLGVTEAGEGEDGRVKSAVGIGALLEDGLGDTIRVSLTEEPEYEAPVAKALALRYENPPRHADPVIDEPTHWPINPYHYERRHTRQVVNIGGHQVPRVMADLTGLEKITPASLFGWGLQYSVPLDKWTITDQAADYIFAGGHVVDFEIPGTLGVVQFYPVWVSQQDKPRHYPWLMVDQYLGAEQLHPELNFVYCTWDDLQAPLSPEGGEGQGVRGLERGAWDLISKLKADPTVVLVLDTYNPHGMAEQRRLIVELMNQDCPVPVILGRAYGTEGAGVAGTPGIPDAAADHHKGHSDRENACPGVLAEQVTDVLRS
jgi:1-hydroxy-2-methyl-2-(E)-butenyl 4-diphosphate synthase